MTCHFTSFFKVFQDHGSVIMKGCVQWNPDCDGKDSNLQQALTPGPLALEFLSV